MALPFEITSTAHDPRALTILAKTIYRELRGEGYAANGNDDVGQRAPRARCLGSEKRCRDLPVQRDKVATRQVKPPSRSLPHSRLTTRASHCAWVTEA